MCLIVIGGIKFMTSLLVTLNQATWSLLIGYTKFIWWWQWLIIQKSDY